MYDFQPETAEIMNNGGASNAGFNFLGVGALYYDGDMFQLNNDVTSIRYFRYHINSPASCMAQTAFSLDPCEMRLSVSFIPNSGLYGSNSGVSGLELLANTIMLKLVELLQKITSITMGLTTSPI